MGSGNLIRSMFWIDPREEIQSDLNDHNIVVHGFLERTFALDYCVVLWRQPGEDCLVGLTLFELERRIGFGRS